MGKPGWVKEKEEKAREQGRQERQPEIDKLKDDLIDKLKDDLKAKQNPSITVNIGTYNKVVYTEPTNVDRQQSNIPNKTTEITDDSESLLLADTRDEDIDED